MERPLDFPRHLPQRRLREHPLHRQNPEQLDPQTPESPPREIPHILQLVLENLVHHHTDNLDTLELEQRLVERPLVDRSPDPTRRHQQHLASQQPRHRGIRQIKNRPHARMPAALDDRKILFPTRPVERIADPLHQCVVVRLVDVAPREIRLHRDRAHVLDRNPRLEHRLHEQAVIIDPPPVHFREPLPDGLDVADAPEPLAQRGIEPEGHRRLAGILLGGGDEKARRDRVHRLNPQAPRRDKASGIRSPASPPAPPSPRSPAACSPAANPPPAW